jgi:modulator of FtsH protease HflC
LLVGLLIASMMRTRVPDEWMWLRDRIVKYTGLRLTAGSLASARLGLLAPCFGSPAGCSWSNPAGIIVLALTLAIAGLAVAATCFSVDVAEYGLVTRFGRVVRVIVEPGFHVTAPFDRVVRLDKRILFSRPARSEYLTADKKNVVVDTLATWRIADPERFLAAFATRDAAEVRLADVVLAEIGAAIGRYPASVLISTDPAESRYEAILSEIGRRTSDFAKPTYGIEVLSVDLRSMALPELNREHVFDRMKAEQAKIAKENRSAGELEAKKIIAEADHEKSSIDADAAGKAERVKAEGDAEASRTYVTLQGVCLDFDPFGLLVSPAGSENGTLKTVDGFMGAVRRRNQSTEEHGRNKCFARDVWLSARMMA